MICIHVCTLQHAATRCNTLQLTATHCNALQVFYDLNTCLLYFVWNVRRNRHVQQTCIQSTADLKVQQTGLLYKVLAKETCKRDLLSRDVCFCTKYSRHVCCTLCVECAAGLFGGRCRASLRTIQGSFAGNSRLIAECVCPTTLQHSAPHCTTLQHTAPHCNMRMPYHTATHCNTLHHTATHCNTLQHAYALPHCNTLQHTATHCNTLQHTATCVCPTTLQHTAMHCNNTLQHTATEGNRA